nr:putative Ig domain-containing protein [Leucobacter chromiireducens]
MGIAFTRVSGLSLAPDALPDGLVGDAYSAEVDAFGTPAPTLALTGDLPDGLSFDTASGEITGTPTHAGTFEFTVTAANGVDRDQSRTYTVVIGALPHITTDSLPNSTVDDKYRHSVDTDGYPDPSLSVSDGELPPGLSLDAASGVLSGTATKAGEYSFSLTATNDFGADTKQYTISVAAAPVPPTVTPPGTKPPVTEPPTTEPPVTQPPAAEGNGDEKSEQLPETGAAGLWSLGAVALALCAGGAVLALRPSRRRVKG